MQTGRWHQRKRSAFMSLACACALVIGCGGDTSIDAGEPAAAPPESAAFEADDWGADMKADEIDVRAHVADRIAFAPGPRGAAALGMLLDDPEPKVRRRAALAYGEVLGRKGIARLKQMASTDADEEVRNLALAALRGAEAREPAAPRSWIRGEVVSSAAEGEPFTIAVEFGSSEAAPNAKLYVHPPDGVEVLAPEGGRWMGPVAAGATQTATFTLKAKPGLPAGARSMFRLYVNHDQVDGEQLTTLVELAPKGGK